MGEPGRFAFVLHPLAVADFARKYPPLRLAPPRALEWVARLVPPLVAARITGIRSLTGATAEGWFIGLPLTTRVLLASDPEFVYHRLVQCGHLAQRLGAGILGLGAFTKVVGDAGATVAQRLPIAVTTGNSYTAATAVEGALLAAARMEIDLPRAHALVVGASGAVGTVCSQLLAPHVGTLTLAARSVERLEALAERLRAARDRSPAVQVTTDLRRALARADLVLTVSSATDVLIQPRDLRPGAVVCDVARPRNVSRLVYQQRDDVLVIDGGVIEVPGEVQFGLDFGFPPRTCEACMAETMVLALEGRYEDYTVGREIALERVREIETLARRHGFRLAGFRRFERAISEEEVERIKAAARRPAPLSGAAFYGM
ncbi:MAG: shikimate dehydrogenase [Armatimonadota bacterium]|nr:shikimate dehydrogenase [Armatimonadota bacterium]MDR7463867.1 shikimate dehydrogenase [Armatimonadota bacterium]MDR7469935.1 shikimate dehydrogenase [Armatimonadota bacterium]MDR7474620.1 shikimate dehydrogenase [Armatimonadota bacterium]MDR7539863.1 shikimate dehydrogenase [Armatimonadota bacterium]